MEIGTGSVQSPSERKEPLRQTSTSQLIPKEYSSSSTPSSECMIPPGRSVVVNRRRRKLVVPRKKTRRIRKLTESESDSGAEFRKLVKHTSKAAQKCEKDELFMVYQSPQKKRRTRIEFDDSLSPIFTPPGQSAKNEKSRKINTPDDELDSFLFRDLPDVDRKDQLTSFEAPQAPSERQRIVRTYKSFATVSKHDLSMQKNKTSPANLQHSCSTSLSDSLWEDFVNNMDESQKISFKITNLTSNAKKNNQKRKEEYTESVVIDRKKRQHRRRTRFEDDESQYENPEMEDRHFEKGGKNGGRMSYKEFRQLRNAEKKRFSKSPSLLRVSTTPINISSSPYETSSPVRRIRQNVGDKMKNTRLKAGSPTCKQSPVIDMKELSRIKRQLMKDRSEIEAKFSGSPSKLKTMYLSPRLNRRKQVKKNPKILVERVSKEGEENSASHSRSSNKPTIVSVQLLTKPLVYKYTDQFKIVLPKT